MNTVKNVSKELTITIDHSQTNEMLSSIKNASTTAEIKIANDLRNAHRLAALGFDSVAQANTGAANARKMPSGLPNFSKNTFYKAQ